MGPLQQHSYSLKQSLDHQGNQNTLILLMDLEFKKNEFLIFLGRGRVGFLKKTEIQAEDVEDTDLLRGSHRLQLPVFLSAAIRQPDTEVQPNSHLLQSQEHNVQIKKVENSLHLISMQRLPVHLLAFE
ncbi:uncharacterized protein LOC116441941 isoform X1 [Tachysurus ichikawai]